MLNGKNRSYLRSQANKLNPVIHVGKEGVTDAVIEQLDQALEDHELLKVRILESVGRSTRSCAEELATATAAEVVQVIGGIAVLFRQRDEDSNYKLKK
ncbi:ribosome assembly RNA-binding protein YhbY [Halanaerobium sp. Z-7514]|uniref:Ribosome assembly RNA-binding protein YhbY n=1 Tax=Halanaerobium polyolivorans TaxID=2886943 RepID=A0AAW4WT23_9FIRM|nr:ribosome assembly RNA-binding protein YhbY [Halanaerobium polyolivorans]MCC3144237.1 ribosome assembly RNA-binding protein YhbY [Halanaerobium polyolivorans]RQD72761.1 MAG: ribosome assembly RNA-binding protein YhbY [Halanaerobium sp. MSAO_Bac5]